MKVRIKMQAISTPALVKWFTAFILTYWLMFPAQARQAIGTLVIFMVIDVVTGLWASGLHGKIDSSIGRKGLSRKLATIAFLLVAHLIEHMSGAELNIEVVGAIGYTINEAISIIENFSVIGVPIPGPLVAALLQAKKLRINAATEDQLRELREAKPQDPKTNG